jgi:NAD(P)-dependent dehydrogenase (short-subunit alcohol dehydrogenase family)
MSPRVALILGAGPNIGAQLASAFEARGYKIALGSRSADASQNTDSKVHVKVDLSKPESVKSAFEQVEKGLGAPGVVVYNGKLTCPKRYLFLSGAVC